MSSLLLSCFVVSLPLFSMLVPVPRVVTPTHKGMMRYCGTKTEKCNDQKVKKLEVFMQGRRFYPCTQGKIDMCAAKNDYYCCDIALNNCFYEQDVQEYERVYSCQLSLYRAYRYYSVNLAQLEKEMSNSIVKSGTISSCLFERYNTLCPYIKKSAQKIMRQELLQRAPHIALGLIGNIASAGLLVIAYQSFFWSLPPIGLSFFTIAYGAAMIPYYSSYIRYIMRSNVREKAMAYYLIIRADDIKWLLEKQKCKKSDIGKK